MVKQMMLDPITYGDALPYIMLAAIIIAFVVLDIRRQEK